MLYRLWDGEIQGHKGQLAVREIDARSIYNQWATAPGQSLNNPRPESITHLHTFSDNGAYAALQQISRYYGIWPVMLAFITLQVGSFTSSGMALPIYMGPTYTWYLSQERYTVSNVQSQVFTLLHSQDSNPRPLHYQAYMFNHTAWLSLTNKLYVYDIRHYWESRLYLFWYVSRIF